MLRTAFNAVARTAATVRSRPAVPAIAARSFTGYDNPDFPLSNGRVIHLDITRGEVANRILCCGEASRAAKIADMYLDDGPRFELTSHREFYITTGRFRGVPVSVIGTLMGLPNTDFVVREVRAVTSGTLAMIRFGSCGGMNETKPGAMCVADKTIGIYRNPGHWYGEDIPAYTTTPPIPGDAELTTLLRERMKANLDDGTELVGGINASADTFYGSQGRPPAFFDDRNETLLADIEAKHPDLAVCEMETNHLFDLAHMCKTPMRTAGAAMVYANRRHKDVTTAERAEELVKAGGLSCLEALVMLPLSDEEVMDDDSCVWNKSQ